MIAQNEESPKYKNNPTEDKNSPTGFYIPENLGDCFTELEKMLPLDSIKQVKSGTENDMIKYHFGLGMWMRNTWGLWAKSRLARYFNNLGIFHPDDMSAIILDSFWRYLNKRPIELEKQIQYYKKFWDEQKNKYP